MKTEVISEQQGVFLVSFFVIGSAIVISIGGQAGRDVWIAIFLGMCIAIPLLAIYARLHVLLPGKDLFDILEFALGKFLGKIVGILYTSFAINLGAIVLRDFGEFLTTVALTETPQLVPVAVLGLLCAWGVKEGIEVLGRWSSIFFRVVLVIFVVTLTLISPEIELKHLQPFFYYGITPVLLGAFSTISFPFAETIMFPMIFATFLKKKSPYKMYLFGLIIGGIILTLFGLVEIAIIGPELYENWYFPGYQAVARINIRDFLQRLEIIAALVFLIGGFVKTSICLLAASRGVAKVLGFDDYRFITTPLAAHMVVMSFWLYDSIMEMNTWTHYVWPKYAFPFQVGIPVTIWIICEIKKKLGQ